ncbi:hypothetical protein GCM10025787_20180 [Saccharopolyspora rosea]
MRALPWVELLAGEQGRTWRTVPSSRTVLAIVHNVTAATRLLDILPLWGGDPRLQTVFTCVGSSAFTTGTREFLTSRSISPIPWDDAVRTRFDLAVSASYGGPLHEITAPLVVVPHGMGYNKFLGIPNPESRIPNPESRIPNPESRIPNPESRIGESGVRPVGFVAAARRCGRPVDARPLPPRAAGPPPAALPRSGRRGAGRGRSLLRPDARLPAAA